MNENELEAQKIGTKYAKQGLSPEDLAYTAGSETRSRPKSSASASSITSASASATTPAADALAAAKAEAVKHGWLFCGQSMEEEERLNRAVEDERRIIVARAQAAAPKVEPVDPAIRARERLSSMKDELAEAKQTRATIDEKISQKTRERQRALNDVNYADGVGNIERDLENLRNNLRPAAVRKIEALEEGLARLEKSNPTETSEADRVRERWVALETSLRKDEEMRVADIKAGLARKMHQYDMELETYRANTKVWEAKTMEAGGKRAVAQGHKQIRDFWRGLR